MSEDLIFIESGENRIECLLEERGGRDGVVVTHPHPQYGGDMHNNVVEAIVRSYAAEGFSTLRFNFRGTGRSGGSYSGGTGEQDDVLAAMNHLSSLGNSRIHLAGYSFGAWIVCMGLERYRAAERVVMVSPPVGFLDFSFPLKDDRIGLVIAGSEDEIARPDMIKSMLPSWNPDARFEIIAGADHFYQFGIRGIEEVIRNYLQENGML